MKWYHDGLQNRRRRFDSCMVSDHPTGTRRMTTPSKMKPENTGRTQRARLCSSTGRAHGFHPCSPGSNPGRGSMPRVPNAHLRRGKVTRIETGPGGHFLCWCNGSTPDFGSGSRGSTPRRRAKRLVLTGTQPDATAQVAARTAKQPPAPTTLGGGKI